MNDTVLEAFYNNLVKFNKDKITNEISKKYPPKFRIKIPPNCVVFDEKTSNGPLIVRLKLILQIGQHYTISSGRILRLET